MTALYFKLILTYTLLNAKSIRYWSMVWKFRGYCTNMILIEIRTAEIRSLTLKVKTNSCFKFYTGKHAFLIYHYFGMTADMLEYRGKVGEGWPPFFLKHTTCRSNGQAFLPLGYYYITVTFSILPPLFHLFDIGNCKHYLCHETLYIRSIHIR